MTDEELTKLRTTIEDLNQILEDLECQAEWDVHLPCYLESKARIELARHDLQRLDPAHDRETCYRTGYCWYTTQDEAERGRYEAARIEYWRATGQSIPEY